MTAQAFTIRGRLPGMNEIIAAARLHPQASAKLKRETDSLVGCYARKAGIRPVRGPVTVDIVWLELNRRRDPDNIVAGRKFVLDALQAIGVLQGDGHKHIAGFVDTFGFDAKDPRVIVTLHEEEE